MEKSGKHTKRRKSDKESKGKVTRRGFLPNGEPIDVLPIFTHNEQDLIKLQFISGYVPFGSHQPTVGSVLNPAGGYRASILNDQNLKSTSFFSGPDTNYLPQKIYHPNHPNYVHFNNSFYAHRVFKNLSELNLTAEAFSKSNEVSARLSSITAALNSAALYTDESVFGVFSFKYARVDDAIQKSHNSICPAIKGYSILGESLDVLTRGLTNSKALSTASVWRGDASVVFTGEFTKACLAYKSNLWPQCSELSFNGAHQIKGSLLNSEKYLSPFASVQNSYVKTLEHTAKYVTGMVKGQLIGKYIGETYQGLTNQPYWDNEQGYNPHILPNTPAAFASPYAQPQSHHAYPRFTGSINPPAWETIFPNQKEKISKVDELIADFAVLKKDFVRLKLDLKKMGQGCTSLIESKIQILEAKIQLKFTAARKESSLRLEQQCTEKLIDKYGVMKMLAISESTYHRKKHLWPFYQIGAKRLYDPSEIKAYIKQFSK